VKIKLSSDRRDGEITIFVDEGRVNLDICNNHMADAWLTEAEARELAAALVELADKLVAESVS
jgi:hypothetical protein